MRYKRVIPIILMRGNSLVKTIGFKNSRYIGDPCNTLRIFNELEVDEIVILDIGATKSNEGPNFRLLEDMATECFMPISYGGGISSIEQAEKLFSFGIEKVIFNTACFTNPNLLKLVSSKFGSQSVVASIDYRIVRGKNAHAINHSERSESDIFKHSALLENSGVGEIVLTNVSREGSWRGYDLQFLKSFSQQIDLPIIANGGCGSPNHIEMLFKETQISAAGVGSMFVYQHKDMGVLVNVPEVLRHHN